ncbi:cytochrome b [Rhodopseudomonas palustris]|nr:cytochrome b [Rhodopseudomonas palustris]
METTANPQERYTRMAILLHWGMTAIIFGLIGVGFYMSNLPPSPQKYALYDLHKSFGVVVVLLLAVRLVWRAAHTPPELPAAYSPLLRNASHLGHLLLYVLMFAVPVSGWVMSAAGGRPASLFGLSIPPPVEKSEHLAGLWGDIHFTLAAAFVLLIIGHTLFALKHHFIDKDGLLRRMWGGLLP